MSDAVRFGWLGQSRRIALHALLVREVSEWSRDWWLRHSSAAIDVYPLDEWQGDSTNLAAWQIGDGLLQLAPTRGNAALGAYLAVNDADDASAVAARIGERALADLASRMALRAGGATAEARDLDGQFEAVHRLELGAYMATLSLDRYTMQLALDRAMADRLCPPKKFIGDTLTPRSQTMAHVPVSVEIRIALGSTSLVQLDDLKVGEVLVGDALLSTPVDVCVGDAVAARGLLGLDQSSRTVTLTHSV